MKLMTTLACMAALILPASAETLTFKEARKALPRAKAKASITYDVDIVPAADRAKLEVGKQTVEALLGQLGASIPAYGALAISPSEGLFVEWLNGAGQFHSIEDARAAALAYCNKNRKGSSAKCAVLVEVTPKGAKEGAFSLSGPANAALRGPYRKMKSPKAFAISAKTGNFGFDRGDGGRALDACGAAGDGATDCRVVVAD